MDIRILTTDDIPSALALCRSAGWNQLQQDWDRLIRYEPAGCFAAIIDGQLVGTVTTTRYGNELAWIGMMLVDQQMRRRGIATKLMNRAMEYLRSHQVACIKLDATPAGHAVYSQLGFQPEWQFHRWVCEPSPHRSDCTQGSLNSLHLQLDRQAFGADRSEYLDRLVPDSILAVRDDGFGFLRKGFHADYMGPLVAGAAETAASLVDSLLNEARGDVYWDIPQVNSTAVALAKSLGFQPIRELTRMWIGSTLVRLNSTTLYALADPGTG